jgi:hypothetical protein
LKKKQENGGNLTIKNTAKKKSKALLNLKNRVCHHKFLEKL